MYDWANSVYALVISSAIFPAYYNTVTRDGSSGKVDVLGLEIENTAIYSICLGISFGIVAMLSPFLSSVADYTGKHKLFMKFFCYLGASSCAALFFFTGDNLLFGLSALMLSTIGYAGSMVYYNSYLPVIATEDNQDRVSARGFALGYLGASTLLLLNLGLILNPDFFGVSDSTFFPRLSFLLTGVWWAGFAQITFDRLPAGTVVNRMRKFDPLGGYRELLKVWEGIQNLTVLRRYLLSFFLYIMGVQTVMFMAASFGEKEVHLQLSQLITVVLCLEYVGIAGAFLFAYLSKRWGNLNALLLAVIIWIFICVGSYFIDSAADFYLAAVFIGIVMGGIQSLSRSTYSKILPSTQNHAGYFSFYDVSEKIAMMCGLIMFGYLDELTGSMRNAIIALALCFIAGAISLHWTKRSLVRGKSPYEKMEKEGL